MVNDETFRKMKIPREWFTNINTCSRFCGILFEDRDVTRLRAACTDTYGQYLAIESASEQRRMLADCGANLKEPCSARDFNRRQLIDVNCYRGLNKGRMRIEREAWWYFLEWKIDALCSLGRDWLTLGIWYSIYRKNFKITRLRGIDRICFFLLLCIANIFFFFLFQIQNFIIRKKNSLFLNYPFGLFKVE